jgi:hypothetical protein
LVKPVSKELKVIRATQALVLLDYVALLDQKVSKAYPDRQA